MLDTSRERAVPCLVEFSLENDEPRERVVMTVRFRASPAVPSHHVH